MKTKTRQTGTIKHFNARRGFGFITRPGEVDIFFHVSQFRDPVRQIDGGQMVSFEVEDHRKGPRAVNIRCHGALG